MNRLLDRRNRHPGLAKKIDRLILSKFQTTTAVLILDTADFSIKVQRHGIIHQLAVIRRMQVVVDQAVKVNGGDLVKFEADNAFAVFAAVRQALATTVRINRDLDAANLSATPDRQLHASIGIGYGRILLGCDDLFGDEVNLASKLGEDIAQRHEVLLTASARRRIRSRQFKFEEMNFSISGIKLRAFKFVADARAE